MKVSNLANSLRNYKENFGDNRIIIIDDDGNKYKDIEVYHFENTLVVMAKKEQS